MKHLTNRIKDKYYTYVPGEFMPIFIDGHLANKKEYAAYKITRLVKS